MFTSCQDETNRNIGDLVKKVNSLSDSIQTRDAELSQLKTELKSQKTKNRILEGRLCRVEKVIEDLDENYLQQTARSMERNLMFYNIPEKKDANHD